MAGRNKQPLAVIQGKGRSNHLTKEEIKRRKEHEEAMRGDADKVDPPNRLSKKQKEEFLEISSQLLKLEIFSNLDVDTLARYIDSKTEYERILRVLSKINPLDDVETYTKLQRSKKSLSDECRAYASDLGLTITSRLKLVIPKTEDEKPQNKFGKFAR